VERFYKNNVEKNTMEKIYDRSREDTDSHI
jgi:hypothetical protein